MATAVGSNVSHDVSFVSQMHKEDNKQNHTETDEKSFAQEAGIAVGVVAVDVITVVKDVSVPTARVGKTFLESAAAVGQVGASAVLETTLHVFEGVYDGIEIYRYCYRTKPTWQDTITGLALPAIHLGGISVGIVGAIVSAPAIIPAASVVTMSAGIVKYGIKIGSRFFEESES